MISFSIFEDDHPNKNEIYNIAIMHKGDDSKPIEIKGEIIGDIYEMHLIEHHEQEQALDEACSYMCKKGLK